GQNGVVYIGFRYVAEQDANYATWCVDNVKLPASGGSGPVNPPTPPTGDDKAGFNTFNGGAPKSTYGTYTSTSGWTAENCNILSGSDNGTDSNPRFTFIGSGSTLAPCLNGKAGSAGVLTSPVITGGLGKLTFNYGFAYKDTQCQFTVNIKQDGAVVKSQVVKVDSVEQFKVYEFSWDVNIEGDFEIEIVNDCIGGKTTNAERVAIWNLTWD
ncbi:MAG: hypothetical protein K2L80_03660, partial [Muribaculaceae bacterium]|nr:hypothetical protein [Muribaculaceae bacterium]